MPISVHNINVDPDAETSSFHKDDRGIINSPKAIKKIKKIWRSSVADVHVYTLDLKIDPDEALNLAIYGSYGDGELDMLKGIKFDPNVINAILTTNQGAERYPITGWMLAHRLFHCFQSDHYSEFHQSAISVDGADSPNRIVDQIFEQLGGVQFDLENYRITNGHYEDHLMKRYLSCLMGTTKACREFKLANASELLPECFAQYMLKGKVTLRPLPSEKFVIDGRSYYPLPETDIAECNHVVKSFENFLNRYFPVLIERAKGRVVAL